MQNQTSFIGPNSYKTCENQSKEYKKMQFLLNTIYWEQASKEENAISSIEPVVQMMHDNNNNQIQCPAQFGSVLLQESTQYLHKDNNL